MALLVLGGLGVVLRVLAFFRYRFDSDEPQHLHIAWAWTAGLVPYRDVFDNHAPLFHLLTAPVLGALGERADVLFFMRALMIPVFVGIMWITYRLARRLYSTRVAWWSVVLLGLFPPFALKSLEYRPDNAWTLLWCLTLVLLASGRPAPARLFVAGLLLGCALSVSLKTVLLVVAGVAAAIATRVLVDRRRAILPPIRSILWLLGGFALVPAALGAWFASLGAWANFVYCVARFNVMVTQTRDYVWIGHVLYIPLMAVLFALARVAARNRPLDDRQRSRFFLGVGTGVFVITLACWWVLISPRDFLPVMPLFAIFGVAAVDRRSGAARSFAVFVLAAAGAVGGLCYYASWFRNGTRDHVHLLRQVLELTRPGEPLMDLKGETVYRQRPLYHVLERISREQIARGLIRDTIAESVVAARCYVAQRDGPFFPPAGRAFLSANFLDAGRLRVSGSWIGDDGAFNVGVPGPYVILHSDGEASGTLDRLRYDGPRMLDAGPHRFQRASALTRLACFWAPAYQRGFSPFHLRD